MDGMRDKARIKIGFYGYGVRALDALMAHKNFEVKYFLTPESRLCGEVYEAGRRYRDVVSMEIVKNRKQLAQRMKEIAGDREEGKEGAVLKEGVACFLMNASPIILDETILNYMDFYNIHPGSLAANRGHHPHLWSILLDEKETEINLHKVGTGIDEGEVIETVLVPVLPDDTSLTLLNRAEDEIPRLLDTLAAYLRGECGGKGIVSGGIYRRKVAYEDYRLDGKRDSLRDMDRKIRARAMRSGGFFETGDRRLYVDKILEVREGPGEKNVLTVEDEQESEAIVGDPILTESEDTVTLVRRRPSAASVKKVMCQEVILFRKSKITDKEGRLLWSRVI